ncbi:hypothetical protein V2P57_03985 [Mycoplasma mycoides subsp. mycoides]|uniref:Uncharacterized protein n=2 Tax=Mycoplasma mycoides subsp. mycoides TaxID=2103 RepID=Q6MSJ3_MYCMS|nr:hypothetical protein [Mycoplasma mycoides]CAE77397.1 Hypothetical protein MSC_0779 [Mycoplasma mycoides subsp. mycoides SC str. PG1]ADK69256.1 conserved hypothetical protein [Mycoplasma mycoides subsp. mycoides SC str. Gladysdale]AIZ55639.1 hypothetical protein mycmycITA_00820 [Mycoplasma mycoides subsp. mycoides]AME10971.1 hypothetical protein MmmBen_0832 [Mycoplasma mycoides subsp. mycoides]AME11982.1 hypothetical protein MmmBen50_0814 [Mycoplasma mycoides subsp. mycoides]
MEFKKELKEIIKNAIFHTVGTNAKTYLKRFKDKYSEFNSFYISPNSKINNNINVMNENDKEIDIFTSDATYDQFCLVLTAFGYIKNVNGNWKIINKELSTKQVADNIFSKSLNKNVSIYRQSKIITLLVNLNIINESNYQDFKLKGKRTNQVKIKNLKAEVSPWEKDVCSDAELITYCLKKIENYEFIKKEK